MENAATTIASWAGAIKLTLDELALDSDAVFHEAGIDPNIIVKANSRILVSRMTVLWQACVQASGREDFGLLVAGNAFPTMFQSLGLAMSFSRNMFDALGILKKHSGSVTDIVTVAVVKKGNTFDVMFVLDENQEDPAYEAIDAFAAVLASFPQRFMGGKLKAKEVHLRRPHPKNVQPFIDIFGETIYFNAPVDSFVIEVSSMMRLLPSYNADVAETAEKKLEQYRAGLSRLSYRDKVFSILRADFESGSGEYQSLVTVSEKLHVTPRTLQNHLKSQGASYQSVLDEVREQVSKKLLLTTDYKLEHISTLLAFSSASNFNRAFKKWTDKTAKEYRQEFK